MNVRPVSWLLALVASLISTSAVSATVFNTIPETPSINWLNAQNENAFLITTSPVNVIISSGSFQLKNNFLTTWNNTLTVTLYSDSAGLPGAELGSGSVNFSISAQTTDIVDVDLGATSTGGAPFWVSWQFAIENNSPGLSLGGEMTVGDIGDQWLVNDGNGWASRELPIYGLPSFSLVAVPIPAAAWLFGSALSLLGWVKRKAA